MIAQNGPGITNFLTPVKTAYWNHTPLLLVTPQAANKTIGQGGFQEVPYRSRGLGAMGIMRTRCF